MSADVDLINRNPSSLRDNRALSALDVKVQRYRYVLSREPWRLWRHIGRVLGDEPRPAGVHHIVVLKKSRSSEQLRKENTDVLGREGIRDEPVHKKVVSGTLDGSVHGARDWMDRVTIGRPDLTPRVHID